MAIHYSIDKDNKTNKYFFKSKLYKYSFDWEVLVEIKPRLYAYPTVETLDNFYTDLDRFTRKKIKREKL